MVSVPQPEAAPVAQLDQVAVTAAQEQPHVVQEPGPDAQPTTTAAEAVVESVTKTPDIV